MLSDLINTVLISFVTVFLWLIYNYLKCPKNLPPGPKGLPYFGYLPFLGNKPHITLSKLRKKYGDIFMIYIPGEQVVVLSSFKLIKEALQNKIFEERPPNFRVITKFGPEEGLVGGYGSLRNKIRQFIITTLRDFGMGKTSLEPKIQDEIQCVIEEIVKLKGQPTNVRPLLTMSVTNIIFSILFGKRLNYNDKDFQQLLHLSKSYINSVGIDQWSSHLPQFLVKLFGIQTPECAGALFYKQIENEVKKYNKSEPGSNNTENFINAWRSNANKEVYSDVRLVQILCELFIAGSDTTSVTLEWALLYLIKHPEVQKKVQIEIDSVIGKDRMPSMFDQKLMPYTEATIMEIGRIASIAPLSDPHCGTEDAVLNGYYIPKDTSIYTNLWAVHNDAEVFPQPEKFMPERFITADNKVKRVEDVIPFSIGRRQCAGEALARLQLFLYLTSLLQHFTFTKFGDVILDYHYASVIEPTQQKICANLRQ